MFTSPPSELKLEETDYMFLIVPPNFKNNERSQSTENLTTILRNISFEKEVDLKTNIGTKVEDNLSTEKKDTSRPTAESNSIFIED